MLKVYPQQCFNIEYSFLCLLFRSIQQLNGLYLFYNGRNDSTTVLTLPWIVGSHMSRRPTTRVDVDSGTRTVVLQFYNTSSHLICL